MSKLAKVTIVAAAAVCAAIPASARTIYDGRWSVQIISDRGTCDQYRYGIEIRNGVLLYDGAVVDMQGRVGRSGAVRVVVSRGNQSATGTGRLGRDFGRGIWRGAGSVETCSGRWEAERR